MFKSTFLSLLLSICVSGAIAAYFYPVWLNVVCAFILTWAIQLLTTYIISKTVFYTKQIKLNKLINERVNKIYSQHILIECCNGDCKHRFSTPVRFDQENIVECPVCHTKNKILINATVVKSEHDQFRI